MKPRSFAIVALLCQPCAALDMFLELVGTDGRTIQGESLDKTFQSSIDILAWSWGASNAGTTHVSGTGGGKGFFQDLALTKYIDASTTELLKAVSTGARFATAKLSVRTAGSVPVTYVVFQMEDVIASKLSSGGSSGEDRLTENISLNFAKFRYYYTQRSSTGTALPVKKFGWDIPQSMLW